MVTKLFTKPAHEHLNRRDVIIVVDIPNKFSVFEYGCEIILSYATLNRIYRQKLL